MKIKHSILTMLLLLTFLVFPVKAQAAFTATVTGATKPETLNVGGIFSMRGVITANEPMRQVVCTIYDATGDNCLQRSSISTNSTTYNLQRSDPYLQFDKLVAGTYYYRVSVYNASGTKKRVINKNFLVRGSGKIQIVNPVPSANVDLTAGKAYAIGGKITSTYKLGSVSAKIIDSSKAVRYKKTVKPNNKTTYNLANSAIDNAMLFDQLEAGTYTYRVSATDVEGTTAVLINRTITVRGNNTSNGSTGNNNSYQGNDTYLNYGGNVTVPSGFVKRMSRPAASNKYYYNGNYNIYYKYNSLAPTGSPYYGNQYVLGNCTWYACGRAMEIVANAGGNINKVQAIFGGDPVGIFNMNANKKMFEYGSTPKVGALAIFNYGASGDAHIAVVEDVINGIPYVSESGYTVGSTVPLENKSNIVFMYQSIYAWAGGRQLVGYIYLI